MNSFKLLLFTSFLIPFSTIKAQEVSVSQKIITIGDCAQTAQILIGLGDAPHDLPFEIDLENLDQGTETYFTMAENKFLIKDLPPANYELLIYYTEDCRSIFSIPLNYSEDVITTSYEELKHICNGQSGKIRLANWEGHTGDVQFSWTKDGLSYGGNQHKISPQYPGEYCATLTDENGCSGSRCFDIYYYDLFVQSDIASTSSCSGSDPMDGNISIEFNLPEGIQTSNYSWNGPNGFTSSSLNLENLGFGDYTFSVSFEDTDHANTCQVQKTFKIMPHSIDLTLSGNGHICSAGTGKLRAEDWEGQQGTVNIYWTLDGQLYAEDQKNILTSAAGEYCAIVTDEMGCMGQKCQTVIDFLSSIKILGTSPVSCTIGDANGTINATLDPVPDYELIDFGWTGPDNFNSTNISLEDLYPGIYTFSGKYIHQSTGEIECEIKKSVIIYCEGEGGQENACKITYAVSPTGTDQISGFFLKDLNVGGTATVKVYNENGLLLSQDFPLSANEIKQSFSMTATTLADGNYTIRIFHNNELCGVSSFEKTTEPTGCTEAYCKYLDSKTGLNAYVKYCLGSCEVLSWYVDNPGGEVSNCNKDCIPYLYVIPNDCHDIYINSESALVDGQTITGFNIFAAGGPQYLLRKNQFDDANGELNRTNIAVEWDIDRLVKVYSTNQGYTAFSKGNNNTSLTFYGQDEKRYLNLAIGNILDVRKSESHFLVLSEINSQIFLSTIDAFGGIIQTIILPIPFLTNNNYLISSEDLFTSIQKDSHSSSIKIFDRNTQTSNFTLPLGLEISNIKSLENGGFNIICQIPNTISLDAIEYGEANKITPIAITLSNNGEINSVQSHPFEKSRNLKDMIVLNGENTFIMGEESATDSPEFLTFNSCLYVDQFPIDAVAKLAANSQDIIWDAYPSIAKDLIYSELHSNHEGKAKFTAYNLMGVVLQQKEVLFKEGLTETTFELSNFPAGVFFLKLEINNTTLTKRIIKQ